MKIEIPKVLKAIELKEYAAEFGEAVIWVWVNPTIKLIEELAELKVKPEKGRITAWFAEIWSQGEEGTRFTVEEVAKLAEDCMEKDPTLWAWLSMQTSRLINEHRVLKKKISSTPESR